jgi:16S rRNA (uracil1498-N3)-methyltransferase
MTRHRFYAVPASVLTDSIRLDEAESHHLKDVLRLRPGATVCVFDGQGNEYTCRVEGFERRQARLSILDRAQPPVESPLEITLAQGLTKGEKLDLIIQKATELGVRRFVPLITAHTVSTGARFQQGGKQDRWQRIVLEATKQCGRTRLMEVADPMTLADFLSPLRWPTLLFSERGGQSLGHVGLERPAGAPSTVCVLIGPEGGWAPSEIEQATQAGATEVSLGRRILRTETAAIVAVSLVQHRLGDLT